MFTKNVACSVPERKQKNDSRGRPRKPDTESGVVVSTRLPPAIVAELDASKPLCRSEAVRLLVEFALGVMGKAPMSDEGMAVLTGRGWKREP